MTPILLQKEENIEKFVASIWVKKVELEAQLKNDCIRTKEKLKSLTIKGTYMYGPLQLSGIGGTVKHRIALSMYNWDNKHLHKMKGTEVPNPRRSSTCDCTCVLT